MRAERQPAQPGPETNEQETGKTRHSWLDYVKALGPGLISGASDNDPTTVATMTVLGSTTIYGLSWLTILVFPMLATIQVIGAQVGVVAKQGLQGAVRDSYGRGWGIILLLSVLAVNVITIGADLEAGAAALGLIFPVAWQWFVVPLAVGMLLVLILGSYASIQRILRYVLLVFAAYVISAILAHPAWSKVLHDTIIPPISFSHTYVQGVLALLGTTLTSYAYVWETIQQGEESTPVSELGLAKADAGFGMFFAVSMFWFILISTGATLGIHHQQAQTAQQAAQALVPVAGPIAGDLFAVGLLASSILAVPVLAASSAYILGSELGWRKGLSQELWHARRFYAAITVTLVVAVVVSLIGISPIQLLFIAGVVGGLGTPISLTFLILVAREHRVMDAHRIGKLLMTGGWAITLLIGAVSLFFLWQLIGSKV